MTSLSLLQPTGRLTLGNLLGALRPMAAAQDGGPCFYGIADLHALTMPHDPDTLRARVGELATMLLACGLDRSTLFVQSQVPAHTGLACLMEATAHTGELDRMIQFRQKGRGRPGTRVALYTYPALMAADILLYRPAQVPVGADQRQHVELARDLAVRFNRTYGPVFTVPEVATPSRGARVMNLQDPTAKMGKSDDPAGVIGLLDPPETIRRTIARAVTDSETGPDAVRPDRATKPGVTNLLEILRACGGEAEGVTSYAALKAAVTEAVLATVGPIRTAYTELAADPAYVASVYAAGAQRCREVTDPVLAAAQAAVGLGGVPALARRAHTSPRTSTGPDVT